MKFALATLYVADMEKSLAFYSGLLGIPIVRRQAAGAGKELVFLGKSGEPQLELISAGVGVRHSGFSIGFEADGLAAAKERLAANGYPAKREFSPGGGLTLCFFDGPDGEEVELIEYK